MRGQRERGPRRRVLDELSAAAGTGRCSTATPTPTTTARSSPWPDRTTRWTAGGRALAAATVARLDLAGHSGAHPRLGVLDVVPFVPYDPRRPPPADLERGRALRDDFARWLAHA